MDNELKEMLQNVNTKYLVEELKKREGVDITTVEPYKEVHIPIEGPAVVLVVTD